MKPQARTIEIESLCPSYCVWELTLACNLRCGHCGSRAGKARPNEMGTEECLGIVKSLAELGCEVITLSGGEPTLRPDWQVIAEAIHDHGMIVNMVTNAYALDEELARRMRQSHLANVAVSIDGPESIHDRIRGKGTFAKTTRAVRMLKEAGVSTTVMTTVNALNLPALEDTYDVAVSLNADRFRTQLGKPMGNLKDHDDWVIRPKDLLKLLPILSALNERGPVPVGIGDSIGYYGPYDSGLRALSWKGTPQCWAGCQAGLRAIGIEADGGIKGCLSMQAFGGESDPFLEGNIRERPLEAIWRDPNAFAYNRQFSPEQLTGHCARCQHRMVCRGGAKCVAAAVCGRLGEDPYCYYHVAASATRWPSNIATKVQVATTASVMSLFLGGCNLPFQINQDPKPPVSCATIDCSDPSPVPGDLAMACCVTEYGVEPDCSAVNCCDQCNPISEEVAAACCQAAACPEYGFEPCQPVDCSAVDCCNVCNPPSDVVAAQCCSDVNVGACMALDYAVEPPCQPPVDCSAVDCCDSCNPVSDEVAAACCTEVACPDYGVEPCQPVDCQNVCCDCDYGMPPPECCKDKK